MPFRVSCPECDRALQVPDDADGKTVRCPACQATFPAAPPKAPPPPPRLDIAGRAGPPRERPRLDPDDRPRRDRYDDEDDRPRRDRDDDDRPRRRDRDDEYDRPRRRRKAGGGAAVGLILGGVGLLVVVGLIVGGIFLVRAIGRAGSIAATEWQPFSPPDGAFSAQFPGTPSRTNQSLGPMLNLNKFLLEHKRSDSVFAVAYFDVPLASWDLVVKAAQAERDNMVRTLNGKVVREGTYSERTTGGNGYEFVIEAGGGKKGRVIERLFIADAPAGKRIYLLIAGGSRIAEGTGDAAKFFDSFQLRGGK